MKFMSTIIFKQRQPCFGLSYLIALLLMLFLSHTTSVMAGDIIIDDGSSSSRSIASNVPQYGNVWNSMAQSFTAEDTNIQFGFRLHDFNFSLPNAGATVIYNLYDGENSYSKLLASKSVTFPNSVTTDSREIFGDVGFVDADFSSVNLVVGQKYTVEITVPPNKLPAEGTSTDIGVWTSNESIYSGGGFFFPTGYDNDYFSNYYEMFFRITAVSKTNSQVVRGGVTWVKAPYSVKCINNTTSQNIFIRKNRKSSYDCEKSGLIINSGDNVSITITGNKK